MSEKRGGWLNGNLTFQTKKLKFRPAKWKFEYSRPLDVSLFVQLSQFSSSCLNFRLVVSVFGWMSHFSSSCQHALQF
ncbi:hypothetical protein V9T40_005133 [Parthenolecanium corni]|uniref:Uncharacterized protein n=1 Tax=Parthenolecanium corni TaxID=536013 RepID=A0AAN9TFT5_9HEMI